MRKVFIGYTSYQDVVYQVAKHSIERQSEDVKCYPIIQQALRDLGIYYRPVDTNGSTEFSITRFLTPWLAGYKGWVMFCDNDVLALGDINELFDLADDKYAIMCVKHSHKPTETVKLDGQKQTQYPRKNWSSVVLWNLEHPKNKQITPELVNEVSPLYLHRFMWLEDHEIGEITRDWNFLVDWYDSKTNSKPKLLHYTDGGPYFKNYQNCDFSENWKAEFKLMTGKEFTDSDLID
ncbi:glycosyltransferase [Psychrosphaera haliotis]|uniref:Glycosyltransferase n=1 Tax=Psychrosphaera haliotis TaxID=555083 RepID=A0A6N8F5D2_9GAMM|nr:glycosyltransferase [Psychrosphaera haliotis]MUH71374.1 glycosyltransferase [Psychrosphaera haliotis]